MFAPSEQRELLKLGCGITNLVPRATATADQLSKEELIKGGVSLRAKVKKFKENRNHLMRKIFRDAFGYYLLSLGEFYGANRSCLQGISD